MALTQVPPALLTATTGTGTTVALSASPTFTGTVTTPGVTFSDASTQTAAASPYVLKNRIINGAFAIDQRNSGASQTITGGASPLAFNCDRWQVRSQGANATVQQVATNNTYRMVFTGLASNSGVAASQSIEAINCADMAGQTVTLSLLAKSTSLTSLTLEAYYANTTNTFGTWGSPTVTSIGTQSVTISTTEALVSYTFAVPSAATTGLQIRITSGALAATQTLTIGNVQLEIGSTATPFERRLYNQELANCQRYYEIGYPVGTAPANGAAGYFDGGSLGATAYSAGAMRSTVIQFCVEKRTTPTVTLYNTGIGGIAANSWAYYNGGWATYNSASGISQATAKCFSVRSSSTSSTGVSYMIEGNWAATAEL
jgi:hypothetical protein